MPPTLPIVTALLARLPEGDPRRSQIAHSGEQVWRSIVHLSEAVAVRDAVARRQVVRRLRLILDALRVGRPLEEVVKHYTALRSECVVLTPWRELNDLIELYHGEEGERVVKQAAALEVSRRRARVPTPPVASWRLKRRRA